MTANLAVDINADMGEGFGRWVLGDDAGVMPFISSANIACGYHGGDPHNMRNCVRLAREHNVAIGAHIGFPDLLGFGRRKLAATPAEVEDYVLYQVGALQGFAVAAGTRVEHVKPHSALYRACMDDDDYANAVARAVHALDPALILVMSGEKPARAAAKAGIDYVAEGLIDLEYDAEGNYIPEWPKKHWAPEKVAANAVDIVIKNQVKLAGGKTMTVRAASLCIHAEADNAASIARAVNERLTAEKVAIMSPRHLLHKDA